MTLDVGCRSSTPRSNGYLRMVASNHLVHICMYKGGSASNVGAFLMIWGINCEVSLNSNRVERNERYRNGILLLSGTLAWHLLHWHVEAYL